MKTATKLGFALWFVSISCIGSPQPCFADTVVALHGDSELKGATVRLSDLFSGVPAVIDRDIAQAPAPGKTAIYDGPLLEKLADKYRLDWHATSPDDHVTLSTAATRITTEDLRAAVVRKIAETGTHGDIEATFDARDLEIDLPSSQLPDFTLNNFTFDNISKRFRCEIDAGHGVSAVALQVSGRADIKRRVPVLAHRLESGAVIALTDIDWATVPDAKLSANSITTVEALMNHELRHTVADGEVLSSNDVMPARLVHRGTLVTLKIKLPYMELTAQGRALQDGAEGDIVRVNNTQSNRMVEGTVTGPDEISVHTGQALALAE